MFAFCYGCFNCGCNGLELHHILGTCSDSALNCAPLCRKCHQDEDAGGEELKKKLLQATIRYLVSEKYELSRNDILFYKKYKRYYEP